MTQADRQQYARACWQEFKKHAAPSSRLTLDAMTPSEWYIMESWMSRDLPLRVVFRAFEDAGQHKEAKTLLYFAGPVETAWRHWLEAVS